MAELVDRSGRAVTRKKMESTNKKAWATLVGSVMAGRRIAAQSGVGSRERIDSWQARFAPELGIGEVWGGMDT
jgi:hypothetical protein